MIFPDKGIFCQRDPNRVWVSFFFNTWIFEPENRAIKCSYEGVRFTGKKRDNTTETVDFYPYETFLIVDGVGMYLSLGDYSPYMNKYVIFNFNFFENISYLFDGSIYSEIKITPILTFFNDQNNVIEIDYNVAELFLNTPQTTAISKSKTLYSDTMDLNEFKEVAAKRLETKPERIRIDMKIINFENTGGEKTIKFVEIDNKRTHAYVKNIESFFTGEDIENKIECIDTFKGFNTLVYKHDTADKHHKGCNFFADQLQVNGICEGQLIVYTAEKLI